MDPLRCLRDAVIQNQLESVTVDGEFIQFGDRFTFPRRLETSYKSQRGKGAFYTLEALVHFVKNKDLGLGMLADDSDDFQRQFISLIDKKDVLEYLEGRVETSEYIQIRVPTLPKEPADLVRAEDRDQPEPDKLEIGPLIATRVDSQGARPLKDRNSVLRVRNQSFHKVLSLLNGGKSTAAPETAPPSSSAGKINLGEQQPTRHSAVEKKFWDSRLGSEGGPSGGGKELSDLAINPKGTLLPALGKRPAPGPPPSHGSRDEKRAREHDRGGRPSSHSHQHPQHKDPRRDEKGREQSRSHHQQRSHRGALDGSHRPIIIVPNGFGINVLLNMFNAKTFLVEGNFQTWEEADEIMQQSGVKKQSTIVIQRTFARQHPVNYIVTDKPPPRHSPDWNRVVAVFTTGAKWQFKDWPFKGAAEGDLVETFHKIKGFHLRFIDAPHVETIKNWNVTVIPIHRTSRHNDRISSELFWKQLDIFLSSTRSTLKY